MIAALFAAVIRWEQKFNDEASNWSSLGSMPTPRHCAQIVQLPDGSSVVIGGTFDKNDSVSGKMEKFVPSTGIWTELPPVPTPRDNHAAVYWNGGIYVIGGLAHPHMSAAGQGSTALVEVFHLNSQKWTNSTPLPNATEGIRGVALMDGSGILVAGGFIEPFTHPSASYTNRSFVFDGAQWTKTKGDLPFHRSNMGLVLAPQSGAVFALGGGELNPSYSTVAKYDPDTNTWGSVANMSVARSYMAVTAAVSKNRRGEDEEYLYVMGGMDGRFSPMASTERYSVSKNTWEPFEPLPQGEGAMSATTITDGLLKERRALLVVGGAHTYKHALQ